MYQAEFIEKDCVLGKGWVQKRRDLGGKHSLLIYGVTVKESSKWSLTQKSQKKLWGI